jgi:hypothetical protein
MSVMEKMMKVKPIRMSGMRVNITTANLMRQTV